MQLSIPIFDWCYFLSLLTEFCMSASVPCKTIYMNFFFFFWRMNYIYDLNVKTFACLFRRYLFSKKKSFWYFFYIWCDQIFWSIDNSFEVQKIILKRSSKCFLLLKSKNTLSVIYFLTLLNLFALLESAQLLPPPITITPPITLPPLSPLLLPPSLPLLSSPPFPPVLPMLLHYLHSWYILPHYCCHHHSTPTYIIFRASHTAKITFWINFYSHDHIQKLLVLFFFFFLFVQIQINLSSTATYVHRKINNNLQARHWIFFLHRPPLRKEKLWDLVRFLKFHSEINAFPDKYHMLSKQMKNTLDLLLSQKYFSR